MKSGTTIKFVIIIFIVSVLSFPARAQGYDKGEALKRSEFKWPEGKKMAISLTFDDARLSQADLGIPLLDKYGVKATFYGACMQSKRYYMRTTAGWCQKSKRSCTPQRDRWPGCHLRR